MSICSSLLPYNRPFNASNAGKERAFLSRSFPLSIQHYQAIYLQPMAKEDRLLGLFNVKAAGQDIALFYLALLGEKPVSSFWKAVPSAPESAPRGFHTEKYGTVYAASLVDYIGFVSKDKDALVEMLELDKKLAGEMLWRRDTSLLEEKYGKMLGYPKTAAGLVREKSGQSLGDDYCRKLVKNSCLVEPPLWYSLFIPNVENGSVAEAQLLSDWHRAVGKEVGPDMHSLMDLTEKMRILEKICNAALL